MQAESTKLYLVQNGITITLDKAVQASNRSAWGKAAAVFASKLIRLLKQLFTQFFMDFCDRRLPKAV